MKVFIHAKPGAKKAGITVTDGLFTKPGEIHLTVAVTEPPEGGRANRAIEKSVAQYFNVAPSLVRIVSGQTARKKVVEISDKRA